MTVCKHVRFSGRVQGVGFRYTTQRLAEGFPVTGYVRNLPGGDVEVVAEGEADDVQSFLDTLRSRMIDYIRSSREEDQTPGGLKGFTIRY